MVFFSDPPSNPFKLKPWLTQFKNGVLTGNFTFGSSVSANTVYAGPTGGGDANPTFRALVAADVPSLDASKITSGTFDAARIPNLDTSKITSGTFDNARINWANPSAIGTATPANGTFLLLTGREGYIRNTAASSTFLRIGSSGLQEKYLLFENYNAFGSANFGPRWNISVRDDDTGGNDGSNFYLERYDDTDTKFGTPVLSIARSTGTVTINGLVDFNDTVNFAGTEVQFAVGTPAIFNDETTFNDDVQLGNAVNLTFDAGTIVGLGTLEVADEINLPTVFNASLSGNSVTVTNLVADSISQVGSGNTSSFAGDIDINGEIFNSVGGTVVFNNDVELNSGFNLTVTDASVNIIGATSELNVGGNVFFTGATVLQSTLNVQGAISNSGGNVTISDSVDITGTVAITGNLTVTGTISDPGGNVSINDNTDITGTLTTTGLITGVGVRVDGDPGSGAAGTVTFTDHISTTPSNTATPSGWFRVYFATNTRYVPVYT